MRPASGLEGTTVSRAGNDRRLSRRASSAQGGHKRRPPARGQGDGHTFAARQFARVVKGVDLRSTAGNCAWVQTPQLTMGEELLLLARRGRPPASSADSPRAAPPLHHAAAPPAAPPPAVTKPSITFPRAEHERDSQAGAPVVGSGVRGRDTGPRGCPRWRGQSAPPPSNASETAARAQRTTTASTRNRHETYARHACCARGATPVRRRALALRRPHETHSSCAAHYLRLAPRPKKTECLLLAPGQLPRPPKPPRSRGQPNPAAVVRAPVCSPWTPKRPPAPRAQARLMGCVASASALARAGNGGTSAWRCAGICTTRTRPAGG